METQNKQKTLKDKIGYRLVQKVCEAIVWVGVVSFPSILTYMGTRAGLEQRWTAPLFTDTKLRE